MTEEQKQAIAQAWEAVVEAENAVVGCAMFAPDALRQRDLPGLVEKAATAETRMGEALEDAGIIG